MPSQKYKKLKQPTTKHKRNNKLKYKDFKKIVSGFTVEELNLLDDWILSNSHKQ
jgi:hypothetical protein